MRNKKIFLLKKEKKYIEYYFHIYYQNKNKLLNKKDFILSKIKEFYPDNIAKEKINIFNQNILFFTKNEMGIVTIFERYLLNFRIRLIYKLMLIQLNNMAQDSHEPHFINTLRSSYLQKYIPSPLYFNQDKASVSIKLQCFRGVLSKKDMITLDKKTDISWETVAFDILTITKKFNTNLFKSLIRKEEFIKTDTVALLADIKKSHNLY